MNAFTSPNDPVFFLHHANIDRIWCKWQEAHEFEFHHLPWGYNSLEPVPGISPCPQWSDPTKEAARGHHACDLMKPFDNSSFGGGVKLRPVDMLNPKHLFSQSPPNSTTGTFVAVEYDDCQGPCQYVGGSQWENQTLSQVMILYGY